MGESAELLYMNKEVVLSTIGVARENGVALVSAGLAFYMFNSLIPLLLFLIIGLTTFGWMESLLALLNPALSSDVDTLVSTMETVIGEGAGRRRAGLIAAGVLAWSSFTMFQSVNRAFGHVYDVQAERSPIETVLDTLLILATVVITVGLLLVVHIGLSSVMGGTGATVVSVPLLLLTLFGIFLPMFYTFPPSSVTVREALPGAVLTAVAWTLCAVGFRIYVVTSESVELYGVAGGVMLLLTWLYIGSLALLLGVVLNAVLADRVSADERWRISG